MGKGTKICREIENKDWSSIKTPWPTSLGRNHKRGYMTVEAK